MRKHTRLLLAIPFVLLTVLAVAGGLFFLHPAHADVPQNLVANPDFANGFTSWQVDSVVNSLQPRSSLNDQPSAASFCNLQPKIDTGSDVISFCNDQLWQNITLPASFTTATLSYQLEIFSETSENTNFQAQLRTSTGTTITTVQEVSHENGIVDEDAKTYTFDVTPQLNAFKGQTVQLYFHANDAGSTFFYQIAEFHLTHVSLVA